MNFRWIIFALIGVLLAATIYRNEMTNVRDLQWTKCKESLIIQVFTGECTLRYKGPIDPA